MTASDPALADPMLRVLREQHPEVDIVLLPQQPLPRPAAPDSPALTPLERAGLATRLDDALGDVLARLAEEPDWPSRPGAPDTAASWHTDATGLEWYEAVAVVGDLPEGTNVALLRATGRALVERGWRARPVPGPRPRLEARRSDGLSVTARVRPDALVVVARTPLVRPVAEEVQP